MKYQTLNTKLTNSQAAEVAGVKPATWRRYTTPNASRGGTVFGPEPDGYADPCGCPYWHLSTVRAWMDSRQRKGRQMDRRSTVTLTRQQSAR